MMFDPGRIGRAFGRAAKAYDEQAKLQRLVREECITLGQACWKSGDTILDIGGGTGILAEEARQRNLGWEIMHLDLSIGMCREARKRNPMTVNAGAGALPFADESMGGVFSSLMLQWADDPLPAFREMARILRPGGRCILSAFVEGTLGELQNAFAAVDDASHVNRFFAPTALTLMAAHAGFTLLACEEETFTLRYPSAAALMRSIKAIGASIKQEPGRRGLMTPRQLRRLEEAYRAGHGADKGMPATWQVLYMMLEKPA